MRDEMRDESEERLKEIKIKEDSRLGIDSADDIIDEGLSPEAKNMLAKLSNQEKFIKYK